MNDATSPPDGPDSGTHSGVPAPLSTQRAARLLEVALTTPGDGLEDWQTMLWNPPSVETLKEWVPEYDVEQRVARGSSGWVYLARHRLLDRRVALKVLAPAVTGSERETAQLRASEGRMIARLSHPNVVRVYDSRPLPEGQHLFVFQYAEGGSLRRRLAEGPLPRAEAVSLAAGMAAGLAQAHAGGIIHRDLKPENILFNDAGVPMIGDFGSAVRPAMEPGAPAVCGSTGTPNYRAPEQVAGGPLGPAVDLYALGVIFHEMLIGKLPEGTSSILPPVLDPAVPADLRGILSGLLDPDPSARRPAAAELSQQLRRKLPGARRFHLIAGSAAAGLLLSGIAGYGIWKKQESTPASPVAVQAPPPVVAPVRSWTEKESRLAVVPILTEFRNLEQRGDWAAGNAYYADVVDYFTYGAQPHPAVVGKRMAFAAEHASFQTILAEPLDFPKVVQPLLAVRGFYWFASLKHRGGASLGHVTDDFIFQPLATGHPAWKIVSHQHSMPPAMWDCAPGRSLDEAAATAWVDQFLADEALGQTEVQLKWYAPRSRYYGEGWVAHRFIRASLELRHRQRPDFRCERRGAVSVQAGTQLRWRVEVPCLSFPILAEQRGADHVRVRTFLLAPKGETEWLIIAEATPLSGQASLDAFWGDGK